MTSSIAMWETLQNGTGWGCFRTLILLETSKALSQHQEELCAFSEVEPLFQSVGGARSRRQSDAVRQCPKSHLWTLILRMDGITVLNFWDLFRGTLHSSPSPGDEVHRCEKHPKIRTKLKLASVEASCLREIDHVAPNAKLSRHNALMYIY